MNTVTYFGKMTLIASLLAPSFAHGAPLSGQESAKAYCAHKGYCARTSNSRIMFVNPRPRDADAAPVFNLIDGQPIR